jgi:mannitol/fructose-specific phosphotransferase system IIA component
MAVVNITNANFKEEVLESDKKVLVDSGAVVALPHGLPHRDESEENSAIKVAKIISISTAARSQYA